MTAPSYEGLSKTLICTAGFDSLRDEAEAYARKFVEGMNEVTVKRFVGVPHPFMYMDGRWRVFPDPSGALRNSESLWLIQFCSNSTGKRIYRSHGEAD